MNYEKNYYDYITYVKSLNRIKSDSDSEKYVYFEIHHIIPKSIGGLNEKENLILLTAREHFLAHYLLCKIYNSGENHSKMIFAFNGMKQSNNHLRNYFNSRLYEAYRIEFRSIVSERMRNRTFIVMYNKETDSLIHAKNEEDVKRLLDIGYIIGGRNMSQQTKDNISISKKGKKSWNKGKKVPKELRLSINKKAKQTRIENNTLWTNKNRNGLKHAEKTKDIIRQKQLGKIHSKEQNKKHSDIMKNRKWFTEISTGKSFMLIEKDVDINLFIKGRKIK